MKYLLTCALLALPAIISCTTPAFHSVSLAPMIGRWEGAAETTVTETGEVAKVNLVTLAGWARHDQVMVQRTVTKVPGQPAWSSVETWVRVEELGGWKIYRVNTAGLEETGFATWDESQAAWRLEARAVNTETGVETSGSGYIRFEMNDIREHDWIVRNPDGVQLFRVVGQTRRVR
jgi:hypothetical protein